MFDFEGHPTIDKDSNERLTETLVGMALRAGSDYVIDAKWDEGALDNGEYMMVIELVPALIDVPHFNAGTGQDYHSIRWICETALARNALDSGNSLTLRQIALLAKKAEGSVRNAIYSNGPDRLEAVDGRVSHAEAERWLLQRSVFQPTTFFNSAYGVTGEIAQVRSLTSLPQVVRWRSKALDVPPVAIMRAVGANIDDDLLDEGDTFSLKLSQAIVTGVRDFRRAINLAEVLQLDPISFVRRIGELLAKNEYEGRMHELEQFLEKVELPEKGATTGASIAEIGERPNTPERVRLYLETHPDIEFHPNHSPDNAKMHGYVTGNGRVIAVEHNLKHPALWVEAFNVPEALRGIRYKAYPASDVGKDGKYGRHSGLKKFPQLAKADLIKFTPRRMNEVIALVEYLIGSNCAIQGGAW